MLMFPAGYTREACRVNAACFFRRFRRHNSSTIDMTAIRSTPPPMEIPMMAKVPKPELPIVIPLFTGPSTVDVRGMTGAAALRSGTHMSAQKGRHIWSPRSFHIVDWTFVA